MSDPSTLAIELWDIEKLVPYDKNAKKHSEKQVETLANLIKKNGWTQPIVVDGDGVIIAGHGRRLAALKIGFKKVPVVCRWDLSKAEADALRLADNQVSSNQYDSDLIREEISRLYAEGIDIGDLGFDEKELDFLTQDLDQINTDAFVEDIGDAVERQAEDNKEKVAAVDGTAAPLADAFGFKKVTVEQSRKIRGFMNQLERESGKKGIDALIEHIEAM